MKNIILTASLLLPLTAAADPLPKPVEGMECLVGTWKGAGSVSMGKDKAKIAATWTCKRVSASWGVLCTLHATGIPGLAAYEETDLMGYEPNTDTYHWYAVTNGGETHDHVASPSEGKLQFIYNGVQEGKPFKEVLELEIGKDDKTVTGRSESFVGGVSQGVLQLALRKS
jgi:hypothetical protein